MSGADATYYLFERYLDSPRTSPLLRVYYALKPVIPRRMQILLRRLYARRQAKRSFPAWPIEPVLIRRQHRQLQQRLRAADEHRLPMINFWPQHKRFACILTHDVEGPAGLAGMAPLLELERRHGLISSWNFVAEDYPIPAGLFDDLRARGHEIGLHGIRHDGTLFRDRANFEAQLPSIHRYLEEWAVVGFRSPSTFRNADWMPELRCLYDSSFPDTDPFEPQPGGCCSIFPFFIGDLVELPVTLVQDHTLFEILRERSIERWTHKGDWIIRNHGLINVIVHPDYMRSPERLALYEAFLSWVRSRIECDAGWHALPCDAAAWWRTRAELCERLDEDALAKVAGSLPGDATVAHVTERDGGIVFEL